MDAWQEFVRRFQPLISSVVAQVARQNGPLAQPVIDDLVQETYLKLCANNYKLLKDFSGTLENSMFAYIKVTAASVALDYFKSLRSQRRGGGIKFANLDDAEHGPSVKSQASSSPGAEQAVVLAEIDQVVAKVTDGENAERDRLIFRLYYHQGFTAADIADVPAVNLTAKGIESLLYRITALVRKEIARRHIRKIPPTVSGDLAASLGE